MLKYGADFFLHFQSIDRFVFRVSDLYELDRFTDKELMRRLDECHIYFLAKRPRLSIVPDSLRIADGMIKFDVEFKIRGQLKTANVAVAHGEVPASRIKMEISPYPHREIFAYDADGNKILEAILANFAHLMVNVDKDAQDLKVMYIGKGLRHSAQNRLESHSTLQRILAHINSNEPDDEVFALAHAFQFKKPLVQVVGIPTTITGYGSRARIEKVTGYKPSLDEKVSLTEAACISYFRPQYNQHYQNFPSRAHRILRPVYAADFGGILVQVDQSNIGGQKIYSDYVTSSASRVIIIDFRLAEGYESILPREHS
jgi:hypothetical protein